MADGIFVLYSSHSRKLRRPWDVFYFSEDTEVAQFLLCALRVMLRKWCRIWLVFRARNRRSCAVCILCLMVKVYTDLYCMFHHNVEIIKSVVWWYLITEESRSSSLLCIYAD